MKGFIPVVAVCVAFGFAAVGGMASSTTGTVTFAVTTKSAGGKFAPRHVLAIWVTDSKGAFVKTLELNGNKYTKYLANWKRSSRDNAVDAITSATSKQHAAHTVTWNCRNAKGELVADGDYQLHVELTDKNGPGRETPNEHVQFTKGPKALSLAPKDLPCFVGMKLEYAPQAAQAAPQTDPKAAPKAAVHKK